MKVSLNWIKEFTEVDVSVDELVEKIGAQLGGVDEVIDLGKKYEGLVIVEVLNCEKHPNADKLSVCVVNDGGAAKNVDRLEDGHVQIVCGAPNVKAGMLAVWIPPGAVVPSTYGEEPFQIDAREIRGVVSNGMMASAKELGLGDSHDGILEIKDDHSTSSGQERLKIKAGESFAEAFQLDDYIIDIENKMFTHRPDCFGMLGVAREIAGIEARSFVSPDWYRQDADLPSIQSSPPKLIVNNDIPELVPRFCVLPISDVKVEASPVWLQARLSSVGVRPINNIVDITNYYMLETGQPLHAYDYDKLSSGRIDVRLSKDDEELKLLGGKNLNIQPGAIVITNGDKPIGLGGIMGGTETEVDETTKNIVLECGTFDMNATRRSAMTHGLFTDAATRFTKGQSPLQNRAVIAKAADEIIKIAGGGIAGDLIDKISNLPSAPVVSVEAEFINRRLGLDLKYEQIEKILTNVEFKVVRQKDQLEVTAPFWRTDIEIAEDIVEEVGRLYGYDHLPLNLPKRDLAPTKTDALLDFKKTVRQLLSAAGANEILTYSFVHGSHLQKAGQDPAQAFKLRNALSPDLQYYRTSLTPSLLDKVHPNIKQGHNKFALFEINKYSCKQDQILDGVPEEHDALACVVAAKNQESSAAAYFAARAFLDTLCQRLGIELEYRKMDESLNYPMVKPYEPSRSAVLFAAGAKIGMIGEFNQVASGGFKLPKFCAGFEVDVSGLLSVLSDNAEYRPIPKYPKVSQDITLKVEAGKSFTEVVRALKNALENKQPEHTVASLEPIGIYKKVKTSTNYSFRLEIASHQKTMSAEEVNSLLDKIAEQAKMQIDAIRI